MTVIIIVFYAKDVVDVDEPKIETPSTTQSKALISTPAQLLMLMNTKQNADHTE